MKCPVWIALLLLCMIMFCAASLSEATESRKGGPIQDSRVRLESAARKAGAAGLLAEEWILKREKLLNEARQLLFDTETTRFSTSRQEAYITREKKNIIELSERLEGARSTRYGLDSLMENLYASLARSQAESLPFARDERQTRLALIRRTLDDPDATGGEKLGDLLEALYAEAEYSFSIEAEDAVMPVNGAPMALTLLRVGRLALLRIPASGDWVERYNRNTRNWVRLDEPHSREVRKAVQIARKQRIAELVTLPVGSQSQLPAP